MTNTMSATEKRILTFCRRQAKRIIWLRQNGQLVAARKLEDDAIRTVELMRAGEL